METIINVISCYQQQNKLHTWFPNTPMAVAVDTSFGPNHTAASLAGIPRMKTWAVAHKHWPHITNENLDFVSQIKFESLIRAYFMKSLAYKL